MLTKPLAEIYLLKIVVVVLGRALPLISQFGKKYIFQAVGL